MRPNEEYIICKQVSQYLRLQYPKTIYHFDLAGLNLSKAQAGMMKAIQGNRGYPDLTIVKSNNGYHGMFLELKKEGTKIFLKDGKTVVANDHIQEQYYMLARLRLSNYYAEFAIGFEDAKKQIDNYLKL